MSFSQNLKLACATQRRISESSLFHHSSPSSSVSSLQSFKFAPKNAKNSSSSMKTRRSSVSLASTPFSTLNSNSTHFNTLELPVSIQNERVEKRTSNSFNEKRVQRFNAFPSLLGLFGPLALLLSSSAFFVEGTSTGIEEERTRMNERLNRFGFVERKMIGDGNCLFRSLCDQLNDLNEEKNPWKGKDYRSTRNSIVDWLEINGEFAVDKDSRLKDFLDLDEYPNWKSYCNAMKREGAWGDHIVLLAASELFDSQIQILSSVKTANPTDYQMTVLNPKSGKPRRTLYISHWHENHYNSLQKVDVSQLPTSKL
eukprot:TRINITY_DN130_c0_g2_i1.p1 TRINITY_DN130_c0_g2~~TRINITY_DN130_c0_g2_i1.p1  ORF type:complete len:312 (-),score=102.22 TRINITY_DN130_c0_g2_i1:206-1141(-)